MQESVNSNQTLVVNLI